MNYMTYNPNNYDYSIIIKKINTFIFQKVTNSNSNGIIIGLSGGIDSSVCLALAANSLPGHNILGLILPIDEITPKQDIDDAIFLAKKYKIEYRIIKINNINSEYMKNLVYEKITQGNLFARIRMNILYYHANLMNRLVIGTGDKSEYLLGYFTKFGDGGADICPIGDLFKTQVRILGKLLDLPENILIKKSGPKLWKDHIAEEEIGNTYEEIDKFLFQIEKSNNLTNIESMNKSNVRINKIFQLIQKNKHKLAMPEICKIN